MHGTETYFAVRSADNTTTGAARQIAESEPFATINATGRVFAALALILFFFKIFRFYAISQVLGPRVLMVAKMVQCPQLLVGVYSILQQAVVCVLVSPPPLLLLSLRADDRAAEDVGSDPGVHVGVRRGRVRIALPTLQVQLEPVERPAPPTLLANAHGTLPGESAPGSQRAPRAATLTAQCSHS